MNSDWNASEREYNPMHYELYPVLWYLEFTKHEASVEAKYTSRTEVQEEDTLFGDIPY